MADLISVRYLQTLPKSLEKVVEQACGEQVIPALPTLYGRVHASTLQQNLQAKVFSQRTGSALLAADAEGQALQASSGGGSRGGNRNYQKGGRGQGGRNQGQGGRSQGGRTQGQGGRSQGGRNQNQGGRNQGQGGRYQGQGNGRNQGQGNGQYQGQGRQSNRGYEAIIKLFNGVQYLHNFRECPDIPTHYEQQLTCHTCKQVGHAVRTCPQSNGQGGKGGNKNRGGGNGNGDRGGNGGRGRNRGYQEGGYANLAEVIEEPLRYDPSGPEPDQPTADWYTQRDEYDANVVDVDVSVVTKKQRYAYFSSVYRTLLTVFFLMQLIYTISCFFYYFETLKFDFSASLLICSLLTQVLYFLSSQKLSTQKSFDYALMIEEESSSSSSKRSYSSSTESSSPKRTFFGLPTNPHAFLTFVVDSGASRHLTYLTAEFFSKFLVHNEANGLIQGIRTASGSQITSIGEGKLGPLHNVLSVPGLTKNLFSVRSACQAGYQVLFHGKRCDIFEPNDIQMLSVPVISAFLQPPQEHLYELKLFPEPQDEAFLATFSPLQSDQSTSPSPSTTDSAFIADTRPLNNYTLLHQRLPHPSERIIKNMAKCDNWTGLPKFSSKDANRHYESHCTGCALGKLTMAHRAVPTDATYATKPGQLFFADLWFSNITSDGKNNCTLLIIDAVSRKLWRYFMNSKSEVQASMHNWIEELRQEGANFQRWSPLPRQTATLKTDPGAEFLSGQLNLFLLQYGINRELAPSKEHCDMVERAIRTVKEATTAYLQNAKYELGRAAAVVMPNTKNVTPYIFWCEAASYAIHVLNKMPYLKDKPLSRNQKWNPSIEYEDMSLLRTFGCRVYCKNFESIKPAKGGVQPSKTTQEAGIKAFPTWGPKGWEGIFMGVDPSTPGAWRVLNLRTRKYVTTNQMIANENLQSSLPPQKLTRESLLTLLQLHTYYPLSIAQNLAIEQLTTDNKHLLHDDWYFDYQELNPHAPNPLETLLDRHRQSRYAALKQQVLPNVPNTSHSLLAEESEDPHLFNPNYMDNILHYALSAEEIATPNSYNEAIRGPDSAKWQSSIKEENDSLRDRNVFKVMLKSDLPKDAKVLKAKWVFKKKSDGRYKSRYTAKGCQQRYGYDYDEVFSPVVRYTTLRSLCAISAANDYHLHQMDVDTAFLYGAMDETDPHVFCQLPESYEIPPEFAHIPRDQLCGQLQAAIYGLKQASRKFYFTLQRYLLELGFVPSISDQCLFHKIADDGAPIWIAVFVDDLVISSPSDHAISMFKTDMHSRFNMKDIGPLKTILGIEVTRNSKAGTLTLSQHLYICDLVKRFGLQSNRCKHNLPMRPNLKLSVADCPTAQDERDDADTKPYRELIGSLMYLMISSRPDIACALIELSRFMSNWGIIHYNAALDLLIYVQATSHLGITYHRGPTTLVGFTDANWAGNVDNARSTTGYIFYLANGPISWKSKQQKTVALSSTEAEYMSLTAASQEALHLRSLLPILDIDVSLPTVIYEDNESALQLANNPVHHDRTKHIAIKHHFIRETISSKQIVVLRVVTKENVADMLTKAVTNTVYEHLIERFMGTVPCILSAHMHTGHTIDHMFTDD